MNVTVSKNLLNTTTKQLDFWMPQFQRNVEKSSYQLSLIVSIYTISIIIFVFIKTTHAHGVRIWLIHKPGNTKFPKRPEICVIVFSTIPTLLTTLSRSMFVEYIKKPINIGYLWPTCQVVLFFDIFSRTAALYHMMYWTCSQYINPLLWKLYMKFSIWMDYDFNESSEKIFIMNCKRRIPCFIYFFSFIIAMPILIMAEKTENSNIIVCAKVLAYDFYHYYDYICLIILPLALMIARFYISALNKDKSKKMIYRLRCYHVTFVLLTIPIFVLNIFYEFFKATKSEALYDHKFANGILVSLTAYNTAFIIKPLVYTTGCNCICCGDTCLQNNPRTNRWVIYWSTPQHKEKKNPYAEPIQVTID